MLLIQYFLLSGSLVWFVCTVSGLHVAKPETKLQTQDQQQGKELEHSDKSILDLWNNLYSNTFSPDNEDVQPNDALQQQLNKLLTIGQQLSGASSGEISEKMSEIYKLVYITRANEDRCFDSSLSLEMNQLLRIYSNSSLTKMKNYVESYKSKLFVACNRKLADRLEKDLAAIRPSAESVVRSLIERIKSYAGTQNGDDEYFHASFSIIKQGVTSYSKELQEYTGLATLKETKQLISDSCTTIRNKLDEVTNLYNQFICDRSYALQMDRLSLEWISSSNICRLIIPFINVLTNESLSVEQLKNRPYLRSNPHFQSTLQCWWLRAEEV